MLRWVIKGARPKRIEKCVRLYTSQIESLEALQAAPMRIEALRRDTFCARATSLVGFEQVFTETIVSLAGLHDGYFAQTQDLLIWIGGEDVDQLSAELRARAEQLGVPAREDNVAVRRCELAPYRTGSWSLPTTFLGTHALQPCNYKLSNMPNDDTESSLPMADIRTPEP
jgi:hypothetical protein